MSARARIGGALLALLVVAAGATSCTPPPVAVVHVIDDEARSPQLDPAVLTVQAGTEVRWRNNGAYTHVIAVIEDADGIPAVPGGAQAFNSGPLRPGETFAVTLDVPGTYVYQGAESSVSVATVEVIAP
ncbi:cupredoxin domain-containing protein [Demequina sp. SO4-13]|uniref:cupredoxin domain-containing protein n=1 Tax=Demequina sp. SO4-13 TaxID=3401027 RepID=UPI003AF689C8